ncbi:hypothetical protein RCO48_34210 [Peribacillus frigoritolerans]|nr:hypothetical protein [Peribacillus frigoritolerans]
MKSVSFPATSGEAAPGPSGKGRFKESEVQNQKKIDVRIIAATNRNLSEMVKSG